ncbi:MAG: reverse transcriptase domain-containing protein [Bacilli bacterium]
MVTIEELFSFENVYHSARRCTKGVRWKTSTQNFECLMMSNAERIRREVISETYRSQGFHEFTLRERGKVREIKSVHITERMVQKTLCDYCLIHLFTPKFIYDNGACMRGKGTSFAIKRIRHHLHDYYQKFGSEGYILQFDISSFFNSINHDILIEMVKKHLTDEKIFNLYAYLVRCFGGECGLGLGSQISQVSASIYLNPLDHKIKDELQFKYYGRYMDDGYI